MRWCDRAFVVLNWQALIVPMVHPCAEHVVVSTLALMVLWWVVIYKGVNR